MIALKKINTADARQVVPEKNSGLLEPLMTCIDMIIPDQTLHQFLVQQIFIQQIIVVINSDFRVYACLHEWYRSRQYRMEDHLLMNQHFTDLEPRSAGTSGDGYIWKYLYTIKPE